MIKVDFTEIKKHYWDIFPMYREYVKHQYELINHRTTWYIALQALLFGVFGLTLQKKVEIASARVFHMEQCSTENVCVYLGYLDCGIIAFCGLGLIISVLFYKLIKAASMPIYDLWKIWGEKIWKVLEGRSSERIMPLLTGGTTIEHAMDGINLTKKIPFVFCGVWLFILITIEIVPAIIGRSFFIYIFSKH